MKIVKEGEWKIPWSKECECTTCKATLLVEEADVKPDDNSASGFYFVCPICSKKTYVKDNDLSVRVREEVEAKRKYRPGSWGGL